MTERRWGLNLDGLVGAPLYLPDAQNYGPILRPAAEN